MKESGIVSSGLVSRITNWRTAMNARTVSKRWIGMALLVGLLALLPALAVQAEALRAAHGPAPLAIHCETELALEGGDPFMAVDDRDPSCADELVPKFLSVEFAGNAAWVRAVVAGEPVLRVYLKRGPVWERIPYAPATEADFQYMIEQENAYMEQFVPGPAAAVASPSASADVTGGPRGSSADAVYEYLLELENAYIEQFVPGATVGAASPSTSVDVTGGPRGSSADAVHDYVLELENGYWNEVLARQEGAFLVTPSPGTSARRVDRRAR